MWTKFRTWLYNWLFYSAVQEHLETTVLGVKNDIRLTDLTITELTDVSVKSHKRSEATQKAFENFRDSAIIDIGTQNAIIEGLIERIEAVEEVQYTADVKLKQRKRKKI